MKVKLSEITPNLAEYLKRHARPTLWLEVAVSRTGRRELSL